MSQACEVKRIQQNSAQALIDQAQQAYNQAKTDYLSCLGPQAQGPVLLEDAKPAMDKISAEAETIMYMERFILDQLKREANNDKTLSLLSTAAAEETEKIQKEIEDLRAEIRTEKRRFMDSSPTASTAVAGFYFTKQPDNQVLIAFLSCFGAFLLFAGLLVLMNHIPLNALKVLTMGDRVKLVGAIWVASIVLMYVGFFAFT